jgi:hypothetical protein
VIEIEAVARAPEKSDGGPIEERERAQIGSVGDDGDDQRSADRLDPEARS